LSPHSKEAVSLHRLDHFATAVINVASGFGLFAICVMLTRTPDFNHISSREVE